MENDGKIGIATGASRKELHWKNREVLWSELLEKLSKTTRTHETQAEYNKATKSRRDEIKDVGGFVGGTLVNGRRKTDNVIERSLLTLDADYSKGDLWENFTLCYSCAACLYSTHSHTPDKPRLRLIIPLLSPVQRDEYEAIGRKVAEAVGIEDFDDTTFQAERLMYWPSTPKDGEYLFEIQDGEWLDPDKVLAEYADWRDASQWPVSSRVSHVVAREIRKQEDPTAKAGIVGAFCRSYDIHEAIEKFLPDQYEKCDTGDNRYTYLKGSTAGGLVTYDGKWAFSHHGTDPASGKLCNAFDLVRIHLFGLLDGDAKEGTPSNRLPSFKKINDLAASDGRVKRQLFKERTQSALEDFGDEGAEDVDADADAYGWAEKFEYDKNGVSKQTIENPRLAMENDPQLIKAGFAKNLFRQTKDVRGVTPWPKPDTENGIFSDSDMSQLMGYLEKYGLTSERCIRTAVDIVFAANSYHPVRDYLDGLIWDGEKRLDRFLIICLGAEDNPYTRAVTRKTITAAVARIMEPGCKFDYTLVLVGGQGLKKSTLLSKLGLDKWFSDSFRLHGDKRDIEQLQGVWIFEIQELAGLYGKNADAVKSFLTTRQDSSRMAFQREKGYFPRQCIFIGTTNNADFLTDTTGNRRFWPLAVGVTKSKAEIEEAVDGLSRETIDQIWAEAVQAYRKGEKLYLSQELEAVAAMIQENHREADPWEGIIQEWLDAPIPPKTADIAEDFAADRSDWVLRDKVSAAEIWTDCLQGRTDRMDAIPTRRINKVMRLLPGWVELVFRDGDKTVRGFKKQMLQNRGEIKNQEL